MLPVYLLEPNNPTLNDIVIQLTNKNINDILDVAIDMLHDESGFSVSDIIMCRTQIDDTEWIKLIYDLRDMVRSRSIREYINPKFELLIFMLLNWWKESSDYPNKILESNFSKTIDAEIKKSCVSLDQYNDLVHSLLHIEDYQNFLFRDHDFIPDNISNFVLIYLNNPTAFSMFFPDVDLDEYRDLMQNDIREQYDERQIALLCEPAKLVSEDGLVADLLGLCITIQAANMYRGIYEDKINDLLRDFLDKMKYDVRDQTRMGVSSTGKDSGEIDVLVRSNNLPFAIIEAMRTTCLDVTKFTDHINKIFGYDSLGNRLNFFILYVQTSNFMNFWEKYTEFASSFPYIYKLESYDSYEDKYPELKYAIAKLDRNKVTTYLYHIVVHLNA